MTKPPRSPTYHYNLHSFGRLRQIGWSKGGKVASQEGPEQWGLGMISDQGVVGL